MITRRSQTRPVGPGVRAFAAAFGSRRGGDDAVLRRIRGEGEGGDGGGGERAAGWTRRDGVAGR